MAVYVSLCPPRRRSLRRACGTLTAAVDTARQPILLYLDGRADRPCLTHEKVTGTPSKSILCSEGGPTKTEALVTHRTQKSFIGLGQLEMLFPQLNLSASMICLACHVSYLEFSTNNGVDTYGATACEPCARACMCVYVRVCVCVRACVRACVRVCMRACTPC
jgi:hypothetical protein